MQEIKSFRLSVWQPAEFRRVITYAPDEDSGGANARFDLQRLHEQIYQWDPGDIDIWACVESSVEMEKIKEVMVEFAPASPQHKRNHKKFYELIELLKTAKNNNRSFWSDMPETVEIENEQVNLRSDPLLCLINHLEWIHRVFVDVPNASVVIR